MRPDAVNQWWQGLLPPPNLYYLVDSRNASSGRRAAAGPWVFYALDPRRMCILLIGGDKTGNDRFYEQYDS